MTTPAADQALQQLLRHIAGTGAGQPSTPPSPLPPMQEDPTFQQAQDANRQYLVDVQAARADLTVTDIARASNVVRVWKTAVDQLVQLRQILNARRRARLQWIEQQLPVGPGIATDASPADRAVLMTAFNNALGAARQATEADRVRQLADAERFDDQTTKRAVLTASIDDSMWHLVDQWAADHAPETGALLQEWKELRALLGGAYAGVDGMFESQAFQLPKRPDEWTDLPGMVAAYNTAARVYNASAGRGGAPARDLIDLADLLTPPAGT